MNTNPNDPVSPSKIDKDSGMHEYYVRCPGLTKREYFAALAMQGIASTRDINKQAWPEWYTTAAKESVTIADALIKELNKPQ